MAATQYSVAEIVVYPVKACKGISVSSAGISSTGFLYDRQWMVVNADTGRLIAMARAPTLALVQPFLPAAALRGERMPDDAVLEINAPDMKPLKVPLKRSAVTKNAGSGKRGSVVDVTIFHVYSGQGVDEGPEAAAWWTRYLDIPARFVRFDPGALQEPRQAELAPNGYTTGFVNTGQFLFASEASLDKVNTYFPDAPVQMNRFRPNVVVRGPSSFEEDKWRKFTITHKGTTLNFIYVMPRGLCKVPTINMEKPDLESEEPVKTMFSFRSAHHVENATNTKKAYFGTYFVCDFTLSNSTSKVPPTMGVGDSLNVLTMS